MFSPVMYTKKNTDYSQEFYILTFCQLLLIIENYCKIINKSFHILLTQIYIYKYTIHCINFKECMRV